MQLSPAFVFVAIIFALLHIVTASIANNDYDQRQAYEALLKWAFLRINQLINKEIIPIPYILIFADIE